MLKRLLSLSALLLCSWLAVWAVQTIAISTDEEQEQALPELTINSVYNEDMSACILTVEALNPEHQLIYTWQGDVEEPEYALVEDNIKLAFTPGRADEQGVCKFVVVVKEVLLDEDGNITDTYAMGVEEVSLLAPKPVVEINTEYRENNSMCIFTAVPTQQGTKVLYSLDGGEEYAELPEEGFTVAWLEALADEQGICVYTIDVIEVNVDAEGVADLQSVVATGHEQIHLVKALPHHEIVTVYNGDNSTCTISAQPLEEGTSMLISIDGGEEFMELPAEGYPVAWLEALADQWNICVYNIVIQEVKYNSDYTIGELVCESYEQVHLSKPIEVLPELSLNLQYNEANTMCNVIVAPTENGGILYYSLDDFNEAMLVEGTILLAYTGNEDTFTYNLTVREYGFLTDEEGNVVLDEEENPVVDWDNILAEGFEQVILARPIDIEPAAGDAENNPIVLVDGNNEPIAINAVGRDEANVTWFTYTAPTAGVFVFSCNPGKVTIVTGDLEPVENAPVIGTPWGKVVTAGETVTFAAILPAVYEGVAYDENGNEIEGETELYDINEYYIYTTVIEPAYPELSLNLLYNDANTMCNVIVAPTENGGILYYSLDGFEEAMLVEGSIVLAYTGRDDTFTYNLTVREYGFLTNEKGEVVLDEMENPMVDFENILAEGFEQVILARPIDIDVNPGAAAENPVVLAEGWNKLSRTNTGMDEANYTHFTYTVEKEGTFAFACNPGKITLAEGSGLEPMEIIGVRGTAYGKNVKAGDVVTFKAYLPAIYFGVDDEMYDVDEYYINVTILPPTLASGDYYLKNTESGLFLNGANSWGTQASATQYGQLMTLTRDYEGKYTIDTHIYNNANQHFLGPNGYVDSDATPYEIIDLYDGTFAIKNGDSYLTYQESNGQNLAQWAAGDITDAAKWQFISKEQYAAPAAMATAEEGIDLTALIIDNGMSRNNNDGWQTVDGEGNATNLGKGGPNENQNAEKWGDNSQEFNTFQTITGLPNGIYKLTVQAFYRYNNTTANTTDVAVAAHADGTEVINSFLYANAVEQPLASIADDDASAALNGNLPFSQNAAADAFAQGLYLNELTVEVTDGTLTIGIKKTNHPGCDWTVWDNFRLYYMGVPEAKHNTLVEGLNKESKTTPWETYYDGYTYFSYTAQNTGRICVTAYGPEFQFEVPTIEGWVEAENIDDICVESCAIDVTAGQTVVFRALIGEATQLGYKMIGITEEAADGSNHVHVHGTDADAVIAADAAPQAQGTIYNVAGQRLNRLQKGINIVGGKKIIVK